MSERFFVTYPPFTGRTEDEVYADLLHEHPVPDAELKKLEALLAPLRYKNEITYRHWGHSVRVAVLSVEIVKHLNMKVKPMQLASLLHDIGKALSPAKVLGKTSGWTDEDSRIMESHVDDGFRMAAGAFDFAAQIFRWHHKYQPRAYPELMPDLHRYSVKTKATIAQYGRILALADTYEAKHRIYAGHAPSGSKIKEDMYIHNPDQRVLLDKLYQIGIFTEVTH